MYGEKPSFIPENLVEQSGANKGNISEPDLAAIGAEAHKKFIETNFKDIGLNTRANEEAETAMMAEVASRAEEFAKKENVSPSAVDAFSETMGRDFMMEHTNLTEERIDSEIDSLTVKAAETQTKTGEK